MFSAIFTKGGKFFYFLFTFLDDEPFPKWGELLKEEFALPGASSSFKRWPIVEADKNDNESELQIRGGI